MRRLSFILSPLILVLLVTVGISLSFAKEKPSPEPGIEVPDWLKRTSYGISMESDKRPRVYIETVQPLYQSPDQQHTFFTHDRVTIESERGTYSGGLGYRRMLFNDNLLAGINTFFDYQDLNKHYRQGVGIEALAKKIEARANAYIGLSPRRLVEESASAYIYEKAVDGFDVEFGVPFPYLPWLKIFGSYYQYDFEKFKDKKGWKARGEVKPFKFVTINLETFNDTKGEQEYRMDGRFNLAFDDFTPRSIFSAFKLAKEPYPDVNLKERTLDRVERNFNIVVEKYSESKTGGATMEIRRGN